MKILSKNNIDEAVKILNNNEIIAFPTETVFGLAIKADSLKNFNKLVEVKNRKPNKPFTLMISNINQVKDLIEINDIAKIIISKFMPGPLTLILKAKKNIPYYLDLGSGFIGIRIPKDDFILSLIDKVNFPLLVPSANPSDLKPAKNVDEVKKYFEGKIEAVVEGESTSNIPSTIIKIDNEITLIRQGELSLETILKEIKDYENCNCK